MALDLKVDFNIGYYRDLGVMVSKYLLSILINLHLQDVVNELLTTVTEQLFHQAPYSTYYCPIFMHDMRQMNSSVGLI